MSGSRPERWPSVKPPLLQKVLQSDITNYASMLHSCVGKSDRSIACNKTSVLTALPKTESCNTSRETKICINQTIHSKIRRSVIFHCNDLVNVKVLRLMRNAYKN